MKTLVNYFLEDNGDNTIDMEIPGGINAGIVAEIRMFSEKTSIFYDRKRALANWFHTNVDKAEINSRRISRTPIFRLYAKAVIHYYKKEVDENVKLNVSTLEEINRQLAIDIVNLALTGNLDYSDFNNN